MDKHLSPAELAERCGVPIQTVYGWNKTGTGPRYMHIGRHVRYRVADVIRWEESRLVTSRTA
jgi:predicted DNA-binding transcriptional regulator AlpA